LDGVPQVRQAQLVVACLCSLLAEVDCRRDIRDLMDALKCAAAIFLVLSARRFEFGLESKSLLFKLLLSSPDLILRFPFRGGNLLADLQSARGVELREIREDFERFLVPTESLLTVDNAPARIGIAWIKSRELGAHSKRLLPEVLGRDESGRPPPEIVDSRARAQCCLRRPTPS
jgi:hypothetical protein